MLFILFLITGVFGEYLNLDIGNYSSMGTVKFSMMIASSGFLPDYSPLYILCILLVGIVIICGICVMIKKIIEYAENKISRNKSLHEKDVLYGSELKENLFVNYNTNDYILIEEKIESRVSDKN